MFHGGNRASLENRDRLMPQRQPGNDEGLGDVVSQSFETDEGGNFLFI
jgi:hypothetical protein